VPGTACAPLVDHPDPAIGQLPVPGIHPVAPPIGMRFGLAGQAAGGPASAGGGSAAVTLRALRRSVRPGGRVVLVGRVTGSNRRKVRLALRLRKGWRIARAVRQRRDGSFRVGLRLRRLARATATGRARRLALQRVRLPRGARKLVLRAQVPGVGRSAPVRVRVRR